MRWEHIAKHLSAAASHSGGCVDTCGVDGEGRRASARAQVSSRITTWANAGGRGAGVGAASRRRAWLAVP